MSIKNSHALIAFSVCYRAFYLMENQNIKNELLKTIALLGGKSDILTIIGDWTDLSNDDFLEQLQIWNETALKEAQKEIVKLSWFCNRPQPSWNHLGHSQDGYEDMLSRGEKFFASH